MAEPYITQLKREREELLTYIRREREWEDSLYIAQTTGRKGSAYQEVERKRVAKEEAYKTIEPLLAE